jgi:inner membrane protein
VRFGWLYAMAFIGCLSHPFFDWLNVYGIRLLEPFSSRWFYGDTLFIIDVWLWAILIASVWASRRREKAGGDWMRVGRIGVAAVLAYVGLNGAITWLNYQTRGVMTEPYPVAHIAAPVPLEFWRREQIALLYDGRWMSSDWHGGDLGHGYAAPDAVQCRLPDLAEARRTNSQLDAFLFWSRAPFATRAADGSVILYDARFYDPRARDRFAVALPDVTCVELP